MARPCLSSKIQMSLKPKGYVLRFAVQQANCINDKQPSDIFDKSVGWTDAEGFALC